jgi:hypothetical protein
VQGGAGGKEGDDAKVKPGVTGFHSSGGKSQPGHHSCAGSLGGLGRGMHTWPQFGFVVAQKLYSCTSEEGLTRGSGCPAKRS